MIISDQCESSAWRNASGRLSMVPGLPTCPTGWRVLDMRDGSLTRLKTSYPIIENHQPTLMPSPPPPRPQPPPPPPLPQGVRPHAYFCKHEDGSWRIAGRNPPPEPGEILN